ncbi:hypothetical protein QJS10_CPB13g01226 [Acorus calamus]|uniref:RING-type domain-containing protein n=1 Tax=Acorus calamus TaxID=4465 RepID=A0AAV9DI98_ACOCL|nr:hypothetical protein QJS10_CPB13g01226 [Acorus calamus]
MEAGQSSRTKITGDDGDVWAKLVPSDSSYSEVEIRSHETGVCCEAASSSCEKSKWCKITRNPNLDSAIIINTSSGAIIVDEIAIEEGGSANIKSGSQIISGPTREGHLSYTFLLCHTQEHKDERLKVSIDVEHCKCSICLNIWHDVVSVTPCLHNFCNGCFSGWVRTSKGKHKGIICPQCRAAVQSVGRNYFLRNIEEAILQSFSAFKRSDEELMLLDRNASNQLNPVVSRKLQTRKRPFSTSSNEMHEIESCPQCGSTLGGFRCNQNTTHLQCQACQGMMPSRSDIGVPQKCLGCDRAFCGAYWQAHGVDATTFGPVCSPQTFKSISERTITRIPELTHENNRYEQEITEMCIQQMGTSLQSVISEWVAKFNSRNIDRARLQLNNKETINAETYLCDDCYHKLVSFFLYWFRITLPTHYLPLDASKRENCWYGYACRTQHRNNEHAQKRNHVCRPTRGNPIP